jgi:hypothetical protein
MTPVSINSIKVLGYTPQAAAPLALNGSHPVKGPIDDPCLSIDIGGEWMEICW